MKLGFRARLFVGGVLLIAVTSLASGLYLEVRLSGWLRSRIVEDLLAHARSAAELLRVVGPQATSARVDALADRLGRAMGMRVTVVDARGRVVGDSSLDAAALAALPSHADRPEVRTAREQGSGVARRLSATLGQDLLYVAVRFRSDGAVVRVAQPLAREKGVLSSMRWLLVLSGLLTLAVVILLAALGSRALSRTLRTLVDNSRAILTGQAERLPVDSRDEIANLAGSFNILAEQLESNVAQLARERDMSGAVLEGMSESVVALDGEGKVTLVNREALALLGLDAPPIGQPLAEIIPLPGLQELIDQAEDEPLTDEFKVRQADRDKRWMLVTAAPLKHARGRVVVLRDMSEMRKLEGMRRNFVANVSHELRTPVSIIRANTETLLDGALEDGPRARVFLEAVLRHTERLARIISDLLDISRVEAGSYPLELERVRVQEVAERAAQLMEEPAERKQVSIEVEVGAQIFARADGNALEQVLFNLLENAIKYTPEGGHVRLSACEIDDGCEIAVTDDGGGIPEKHRSRLFERFYRVDRGRSRDMGGTGLGLAIVKHLCEAMGGKVGMRPAEPSGSVFFVHLPPSA